jgi:hypothetical protein
MTIRMTKNNNRMNPRSITPKVSLVAEHQQ